MVPVAGPRPLTRAHRRRLLAASQETTPANGLITGQRYWARVVQVHDGDTLQAVLEETPRRVRRWCVRVYGVDTCELHPRHSLFDTEEARLAEQRRGECARDLVRDWVLDRVVQLECRGYGKFGRLLARVHFGERYEREVGADLLAAGQATAYLGGRKAMPARTVA
jgi:endonuclease YncB( thermonuclease family)